MSEWGTVSMASYNFLRPGKGLNHGDEFGDMFGLKGTEMDLALCWVLEGLRWIWSCVGSYRD